MLSALPSRTIVTLSRCGYFHGAAATVVASFEMAVTTQLPSSPPLTPCEGTHRGRTLGKASTGSHCG